MYKVEDLCTLLTNCPKLKWLYLYVTNYSNQHIQATLKTRLLDEGLDVLGQYHQLEHLVLAVDESTYTHAHPHPNASCRPVPFFHFFSILPALKKLSINNLCETESHADKLVIDMLKAAKEVNNISKKRYGRPLALKEIVSYPPLALTATQKSLEKFNLLEEAGLKIEKIEICDNPHINPQDLHRILKYLSEDLTELQFTSVFELEVDEELDEMFEIQLNASGIDPFDVVYKADSTCFCGLRFPKLVTLNLSFITFKNWQFLKHMPNLKTISMSDPASPEYSSSGKTIYNKIRLFDNEDSFVKKVKLHQLKDMTVEYMLNAEDLKRLICLAPNLDKLSIPLDNKLFAIVCEGWTKLRNLNVLGNRLHVDRIYLKRFTSK